jgi:RNA recognition motif-containing protein
VAYGEAISMETSTTLYVGNLPWSITEQELSDWVSRFGKVTGARIVTDRETSRSRGFGFVEVAPEDVAKVVEALNGVELGGRVVTVNEARARQR